MSARKPKDRLQPCLLDRLLDDTPALDAAKVRLQALEQRRRELADDAANARARQELDGRIAAERLTVRELEERLGRAVVTEQQLRASVMRDLGWLLATPSMESATDLTPYPEVQRSVLNFGVRGMAGWNVSQISPARLQAVVKEAIQRFEPRILPRQLEVNVTTRANEKDPNTLSLEIKGEMWAQPLPQALYLRSLIDLETGEVRMQSAAS